MRVAHLTTVDMSLRLLLMPQLLAVLDAGGEVMGISAPGPWVEDLERAGVHHVPLPSSTRGFDLRADLKSARELWRVLRRDRPDVLHTHNPKPGLYGRVVGRLAGVPIVVNTVHGLYATEDDPWTKRAVVYCLEAIAARFSDAELMQNTEDLALMTRLHLTRADHARLLGNGIDLSRFDPDRFSRRDRLAVRDQLGVGDGEILVGTVGRLVAEKGYPELFQAMDSLPNQYRLVVVGADDPQKADALPREMIETARARGVVFVGHRADVDLLYSAMDLFVLASHREGFPRAAMEAAAMGLPIIASNIRGCRQVVDDGVNGVLVPPRDAVALSRALRNLGDAPERRRDFGIQGRRIAFERFDERRCVEIVMETYRDVAQRKRIALD